MNSNPYNPTPIVALALLVLTVVCIAGAVLGNSTFFNRPTWDQAVVASGTVLANTQSAMNITATVEARNARGTDAVAQLTALPPQLTLAAIQPTPAPAVRTPSILMVVLLLVAFAVITAIIVVAVAISRYLKQRSNTDAMAARAKLEEAKARHIQARRSIIEDTIPIRAAKIAVPTTPVNHPKLPTDSGKIELEEDAKYIWPDDEENYGVSNLPWVE